jgi:hypothetical protein
MGLADAKRRPQLFINAGPDSILTGRARSSVAPCATRWKSPSTKFASFRRTVPTKSGRRSPPWCAPCGCGDSQRNSADARRTRDLRSTDAARRGEAAGLRLERTACAHVERRTHYGRYLHQFHTRRDAFSRFISSGIVRPRMTTENVTTPNVAMGMSRLNGRDIGTGAFRRLDASLSTLLTDAPRASSST